MIEPARISVIIPALNEAGHIQATLNSLQVDPEPEIIVVDGGSTDATRALALASGAKVLSSPPGRALQQNFGAAAASGDILFFLHADTKVPIDYAHHIRHALKTPRVSAGAFSLATAADLPGLRAIAKIANLRSKWLQLPYGDQGLFLRSQLFFHLHGFPPLPIMEDFIFVKQLQHHGRLVTLPQTIVTSDRRWRRLGLWQTTFINQLMISGYYLGIAPATLVRIYYQRK